jgi:hypothetical protein
VLVSKVLHLLDPTVEPKVQGMCSTNENGAWTWVMKGGPTPEQWMLTVLPIPNQPHTFAIVATIDGVNMWKLGFFRNNSKAAKILRESIKKIKINKAKMN